MFIVNDAAERSVYFYHICMSYSPHVTTWEQIWNKYNIEKFTKVYQHIPVSVKFEQLVDSLHEDLFVFLY
jgi:hypothetical protein